MTQAQKIAMSPLIRKLQEMEQRLGTLEESLNDPSVLANQHQVVAVAREAGQLRPVVEKFRQYKKAVETVAELEQLSQNKAEGEMAELAASELPGAQAQVEALLESLKD